jgi:hypothetical protein
MQIGWQRCYPWRVAERSSPDTRNFPCSPSPTPHVGARFPVLVTEQAICQLISVIARSTQYAIHLIHKHKFLLYKIFLEICYHVYCIINLIARNVILNTDYVQESYYIFLRKKTYKEKYMGHEEPTFLSHKLPSSCSQANRSCSWLQHATGRAKKVHITSLNFCESLFFFPEL